MTGVMEEEAEREREAWMSGCKGGSEHRREPGPVSAAPDF